MSITQHSLRRSVPFLLCCLAAFLVIGCHSNQNAPEQTASAKPTVAAAPQETRTPIRIKAGASAPFTDSEGKVWLADTGFDGGDTVERATDLPIANTKDPVMYRTEHYGMSAFSIAVPNGKYTVKLHFAETYEGITGAGQRVFTFNVQGKDFKDFDIFKKAGGEQRAYIESVPVEITNGKLTITFTTNIENPAINAIEIIPA